MRKRAVAYVLHPLVSTDGRSTVIAEDIEALHQFAEEAGISSSQFNRRSYPVGYQVGPQTRVELIDKMHVEPVALLTPGVTEMIEHLEQQIKKNPMLGEPKALMEARVASKFSSSRRFAK